MTNAQRQKRYRERHHDELAHITLDLHVDVRERLDRLAWHFQWSMTQLIEEMAAHTGRAVEGQLTGAALKTYRAAGYEDSV